MRAIYLAMNNKQAAANLEAARDAGILSPLTYSVIECAPGARWRLMGGYDELRWAIERARQRHFQHSTHTLAVVHIGWDLARNLYDAYAAPTYYICGLRSNRVA